MVLRVGQDEHKKADTPLFLTLILPVFQEIVHLSFGNKVIDVGTGHRSCRPRLRDWDVTGDRMLTDTLVANCWWVPLVAGGSVPLPSSLCLERKPENLEDSLDLTDPDLSGCGCSMESDRCKALGDSRPLDGSLSAVSLLRGETVEEGGR